jgi:hypothetical protein
MQGFGSFGKEWLEQRLDYLDAHIDWAPDFLKKNVKRVGARTHSFFNFRSRASRFDPDLKNQWENRWVSRNSVFA